MDTIDRVQRVVLGTGAEYASEADATTDLAPYSSTAQYDVTTAATTAAALQGFDGAAAAPAMAAADIQAALEEVATAVVAKTGSLTASDTCFCDITLTTGTAVDGDLLATGQVKDTMGVSVTGAKNVIIALYQQTGAKDLNDVTATSDTSASVGTLLYGVWATPIVITTAASGAFAAKFSGLAVAQPHVAVSQVMGVMSRINRTAAVNSK